MSTPETVIRQLRADLSAANNATGEMDTTIHDAIGSLIAGYGASGPSLGGFDLLCDTVIDVPQSEQDLSIVINTSGTGNKKGNTYLTFFEFLGDIPTDTTVSTAWRNIHLNATSSNEYYSSQITGSASVIKAGVLSLIPHVGAAVIHISNIGTKDITITVKAATANYDTCRGQWHMRCYMVNSWEDLA